MSKCYNLSHICMCVCYLFIHKKYFMHVRETYTYWRMWISRTSVYLLIPSFSIQAPFMLTTRDFQALLREDRLLRKLLFSGMTYWPLTVMLLTLLETSSQPLHTSELLNHFYRKITHCPFICQHTLDYVLRAQWEQYVNSSSHLIGSG